MALFQTKETRERERLAYQRRMFPGGEEQKAREEALLAALLPKLRPWERLYQLLALREALTGDPEERDEALRRWYGSELLRKVPREDRAALYALELCLRERGCAAAPEPEEVRRRAADLLAGELKDWPLRVPARLSLHRLLLGK